MKEKDKLNENEECSQSLDMKNKKDALDSSEQALDIQEDVVFLNKDKESPMLQEQVSADDMGKEEFFTEEDENIKVVNETLQYKLKKAISNISNGENKFNSNFLGGKAIFYILSLSICINIGQSIYVANLNFKLETEISGLNSQLEIKNDTIESQVKTIGSKNSEILTRDYTISELEKEIESAEPWLGLDESQKNLINEKIEEMKAKERAEIEAEIKAREEAEAKRLEEERKAQEKKQKEEAEAKEKAEKEKYNTGITYDQLARTPDSFFLDNCKFRGKVIQVMEGDRVNQIRLAVGGDYDKVLLVEYNPSKLDTRILEDDYVTVYGKSMGIHSYESVLGATISIPSMVADKVTY